MGAAVDWWAGLWQSGRGYGIVGVVMVRKAVLWHGGRGYC